MSALDGLRHVVPDGDSRVGEPGMVAMSAYVTAMRESYRATVGEAVRGLLEKVVEEEPEMARKAANTDADAIADRLFERDVLPMLEAHFEQGHVIFAGGSVDN